MKVLRIFPDGTMPRFIVFLCPLVMVTLLVAPNSPGDEKDGGKNELSAGAQDEPRPSGRGDGKRASGERDVADEELSKEDHEKIRRLLREVWDDPAVVQSRHEVGIASENLRKVLRAKVQQLDPEGGKLLERIKGRSRHGGGDHGGMPGGGPPRGGRSDGSYDTFEYMAKPPFYSSLSGEQQKKYDAAYRAALESDTLREVGAQMRQLRERSEALRMERTKHFGRARKLLWDAMMEADPSLKEFVPRHEYAATKGRPGGGRGGKDGDRSRERKDDSNESDGDGGADEPKE